MSFTTEVIWAMMPGETVYPSAAAVEILHKELGRYIYTGKTTVAVTKTLNSDNNLIVVRNWIDEASANEWLAICAEFNPVSAKLI